MTVRLVAGIAGCTVLALTALMGIQYQSDMAASRQRIVQMGSQVIDTPYGTIEYALVGSGEPVLVIHGNGGGFDQGLGLAQRYLGEGFQVIVPSRYGYLRSNLPEGATPAMQADAYAFLLDVLHIHKVEFSHRQRE